MDEREERIARNETLFREVNERIEDVSRSVGLRESLEFLCECGIPDCPQPILLSRAEYEAVRADPRHFVIVPGHEHPEFERVIEQNERYAVVEKDGEAEEIAEATDPRS